MSPKPSPIPGRRRRRLRRTSLVLAITFAAAVTAGWALYRASRPEVRRPGEALPDITSRLSQDLPAAAPIPRLTDITVEAGLGDFVTFRGVRTSQLPEDMGGGAAWGDFDGDGDDDLFLVAAGGPMNAPQEAWAPSRLYENLGDGTFRVASGFPGLRIQGMAAAWGDVDGDGRLDLAVSGFDTLRLFRNGEAGFVRDQGFDQPAGFWAGLAWGDFDNDRDLDLYVCGYVRYGAGSAGEPRSEQYGTAVPYTLNPASFEPERNLLLRNDGGAFTEVAALYGVANPGGRSLGALWHDFDGDGWLDLYVANDISDNALFINRGGETFEDRSLAAWVADYRGAMGLAAGDFDRDGDDDLFVTHWVAQENALYASRLGDPVAGDRGENRVRLLQFSDLAARVGLAQIALPKVGWGTAFADFDADGWLDLVVANGSTFERADAPELLLAQAPFWFWSDRGEHFYDLAPFAEATARPAVGRGLAVADYDQDGDLDVAMVDLAAGVRLLRNDFEGGHGLTLRLASRGPDGAPTGRGEGATVIARAGDATLRRTVGSGSYLSQDSGELHFGLGEAARVDGLEVAWLGGERQTLAGLDAGTAYAIIEGEPTARPLRAFDLQDAGSRADLTPPAGGDPQRDQVARFWRLQRAAMDAMKRDNDPQRAIELFRQALALDPEHEDSRYYLASCLDAQGQNPAAVEQLEALLAVNPRSHRALKQLATWRALEATGRQELEAVVGLLERARAVNPEETGVLALLGEVALLRGEHAEARDRLEAAGRTNRQGIGSFFLRAYLAYSAGDAASARSLLEQAAKARGPEWKPVGAAGEGDTVRRMYREVSPLAHFWHDWDGGTEPGVALADLDRHLRARE